MMTFLVGLTILGFILNVLLIKDFIPLLKLDRFVQGLTEDIDSKNKLVTYILNVFSNFSYSSWSLWLNEDIYEFKDFIVNNAHHAEGLTLEFSLYRYACKLFAKLNNLYTKTLCLTLLNGVLMLSWFIAVGVNKPNTLPEGSIYAASISFFMLCLVFYKTSFRSLFDYPASDASKKGVTLAQTVYSYIYKVLGGLDPYTIAHNEWSRGGVELFSKLERDAYHAFKSYTPFMLSEGYNINNDYIWEIWYMQQMFSSSKKTPSLEPDNMGNYAKINMNIQVERYFHIFDENKLVVPQLKFLNLDGEVEHELDFYLNSDKVDTYTCKFRMGTSILEDYSTRGCLVLSAHSLDNDINIKIVRKNSNSDKPFQFKESIHRLGDLCVDVLP